MRETVRDWKNEWTETNGETDGLEVVIEDRKLDDFVPYVYEGSFKNIPEEILNKKVIENWKILDSSMPERIGAYMLRIWEEGETNVL